VTFRAQRWLMAADGSGGQGLPRKRSVELSALKRSFTSALKPVSASALKTSALEPVSIPVSRRTPEYGHKTVTWKDTVLPRRLPTLSPTPRTA
jgi:hypothetical protein